MNISQDSVVQFHYTLKTGADEIVESSKDGDPVVYLHGHSGIIPGLEKALAGKSAGEQFSVTVAPEEGYGMRRENAVQRVSLKVLHGAKKWKAGMTAIVKTEQGSRQVQIVKVGKFMADIDLNHPLAGKTLTFEIEIIEVREASAEEIEHGHAHGPGGHHH